MSVDVSDSDYAITDASPSSQVIAAEGEHQASRSLANAADVISTSPAALQVVLDRRSPV